MTTTQTNKTLNTGAYSHESKTSHEDATVNTNGTHQDISYWFAGCETFRGRFGGFNGKTKKAWQEPQPFNWSDHLNGTMQGLSPVELSTQTARWFALDIDLKNLDPKTFCQKVFSLVGSDLFVFRTISGGFRVVKFYDDFIAVEDVAKEAEQIEKQIINLGYKCDSGARVPQGFTEDAPGRWIFIPYHNADETYCYSPAGAKLTRSQFEFRLKDKDYPMIVAIIGMTGGGEEGSRRKALWTMAVHNKIYPENKVDLKIINKMFADPLDDIQLHKDINHVEKTSANEKWDKEKYLNGINTWIKAIIGVSPGYSNSLVQEVVEAIHDKYIYLRQNTEFYEIESTEFVNKEQMNDWWFVATKGQPIVKTLLANPNLSKVYSFFTHPGFSPGVIRINYGDIPGIKPGEYFNLYKPGPHKASPGDGPGDVNAVLNYYKKLYGADATHLFNLIALLFQRPGYKARWGSLEITPPGAGKDILKEIIAGALGEHMVALNLSFERLTADHSTVLNGKQLIILNEMILTGNRVEGKILANKLKPFFTNDTVTLNPKFKNEITIPNYALIMCHSNDEKPVKLEKDDRRFLVLKSLLDKAEINLEMQKVLPTLKKLKKDPSSFIHYFQQLHELPALDYFDGDAPHTKSKEGLINIGKQDFESLLDSAQDEKTFPFANRHWEDARGKDGANSSWHYIGIFNIDNLYTALKYHEKFKGVYFDKSMVIEWVNNNCILWPNGQKTKRAKLRNSSPRVYIMEDLVLTQLKRSGDPKKHIPKQVSQMTENELGDVYYDARFQLHGYADQAPGHKAVTGVPF